MVQGMKEEPARYALLSIGAAVVTIGLKGAAYFLTGSVGLLSDAAESLVNLAAALAALAALRVASRPADEEHAFGHEKAEYFASAFEGLLILAAAALIAITAVERLLHPRPLTQIGLGLGLSLVATAVNGAVGLALLRAGRRLRSITLRADAHHLFTDVWTSLGVLVGLLLVRLTGWLPLDPIVALLTAANIVWTGVDLLLETGHGLLDRAIPREDRALLSGVLDGLRERHQGDGIVFHALRTRLAGSRRFVEMHVLVPGSWTVQRGHDLCEQVEQDIQKALPGSKVLTHLEPLEDPAAWKD
jgi:cation diffusion facilitator family transporter